MVTDDARIVDARTCQIESWVKGNQGSTEFWALPACNLTGNLEFTLGGARTHMDGHTRTTDIVVQGKTLFKPLDTNSWGVGLVGGTTHHPQSNTGTRDWYAYVPASFSFRDDGVVVHANLGWMRDGQTLRDDMTWGLGTEARLEAHTWLIGESFGQNHGNPFYQLGLRHWLMPDRVQLDATIGDRTGGGRQERWLSIGLRFLSLPFLP
ncbi:MAG TPA: hypothetical protein VJ698_02025 [Noviherbaspirillum sp.]|uniref:hypothetical protein n=1 Tax=Noviherbaspirillum sp. TaxID=1926288 RepID=UPI002B47B260|nr:hypothetical protein [Noviherbaspirillum sp.]HJV84227.1 hypothetical protein [Noviherbaspirillum sp.]